MPFRHSRGFLQSTYESDFTCGQSDHKLRKWILRIIWVVGAHEVRWTSDLRRPEWNGEYPAAGDVGARIFGVKFMQL